MNNIELSEENILSCYAGTTLKELTDFCIENRDVYKRQVLILLVATEEHGYVNL